MIDALILSEARRVAELSLFEDDAGCDAAVDALGSAALLPAVCEFRARQPLVLAGWFAVEAVYRALDDAVLLEQILEEGGKAAPGSVIGVVRGATGTVLRGERSALNILCRMCGTATLTRRFADAAPGVEILDTRKTTPGLRALEKYAVRAGGGVNHRMSLSDMAMFKDNHIAALGGVGELTPAVAAVRSRGVPIEIEVDSLAQLPAVFSLEPDRILLDNMPVTMLREAVAMARGRFYLEASGGVTLETVSEIASSGVDGVSVGALTHSAPAADIGLDWREGPGAPAGH
ncbi:MAG: carboxylating nicotinate-nucleotide diphosphorylase [Candidatus Fermentibacteraceae bacterium]